MNRREIINSLGECAHVREIECLLVRYSWDFSLREHSVANHLFYELGRTDVDIPIVLDPDTRNVYSLDKRGLRFINSSFSQMIESMEKINKWEWIPDDLPDKERAELFADGLRAIDPHCMDGLDSFWSTIREEIENGLI